MVRSILAVLSGFVALAIVSFAIEAAVDPLLMHLFPRALPNVAALSASVPARLWILSYTTFAVAAGGYVTAWLAPRFPVAHAAIMAAIEAAFTLFLIVVAPFTQPHPALRWNWIVGVILMIPAACLGAWVEARRKAKTRMPPAFLEAGS